MLVYAPRKSTNLRPLLNLPVARMLPRVVDAVAGEVGPERRQHQVVVVPGVRLRLRVAQHVQRRGQGAPAMKLTQRRRRPQAAAMVILK